MQLNRLKDHIEFIYRLWDVLQDFEDMEGQMEISKREW